MKSVSTALLGAGLLLLGACGGGADEAATGNNSTDTLTLEDETLAPVDNALDTAIDANLATDANAVGADVNTVDANVAVDANASVNNQ